MTLAKCKNIISAVALASLVAVFFGATVKEKSKSATHINYVSFVEKLDDGLIKSVALTDGSTMSFQIINDETAYITDNPRVDGLKEELLLKNVEVVEGKTTSVIEITQTILSLLFFAGAFYFVIKATGKANAKSVMAFDATDASSGMKELFSFGDVAGNEEAKESLGDIIDFLKNPEKYSSHGARVPRGVILYGPPGTGKTLMAKAIAGEAGVPFYAVSGSDFVQVYVGVGANRVRELFKKARQSGKAVIFIDEIDALGKKRGGCDMGGNDERDQTLNALLTEMSGFSSGENVIVIAATNRIDTLDDALLRPGRFDRRVEVGLPDHAARLSILNHHAKNKPMAENVDMDALAGETVYFSGAMIENYLNEASISSAKAGREFIETQDLRDAYYTILAGAEKKNRGESWAREKRVTAFHEAGHALMGKIATPENTISKITIIPSVSGAGGFCVNIPPEKMFLTKTELRAQVMVSLAGRASEELVFGKDRVTTGAVNDIQKATSIAINYVSEYGMSESAGLLDMAQFGDRSRLADECRELVDELYAQTMAMLTENRAKLDRIANALIERESLDATELEALVA
ncbi:MAG: AAA family ATPase [Clostridiales bacterium]|jgi:cell division protease FtsH|nr:AAA family ATPase [Clostridiales bacterium]